MPAAPPRRPLVQPEFGPTLPALLRARFGLSQRAAVGILVAVGVLLALLAYLLARSGDRHLVVRGNPVFNVTYDPEAVRRATARPGELLRLEARRRGASAAVTVRPLRLPRYAGDVPRGLMPTLVEGYARDLRGSVPGFRRRDEGKARFGEAAGYQLTYRSRSGRSRTVTREVFLLSEDPEAPGSVIVRLDRTLSGRRDPADTALLSAMQSAFRSFRFGEDAP